MNTIPQDQNTPSRLKLLAAQRQLYSEAKKLNMLSIITSVLFAVVWSILVAILPGCAAYAALWGILVTLLDLLLLSRIQKSTQEKAAKIQQYFDCEVLQLTWGKSNCGIKIDPETINNASNRYIAKNKNYSALENWYSISVGKLPIYQARIICQRANAQWDEQLRRRYSSWIIVTLSLLIAIVFSVGLIGGLTIEKLILAVIAPLLPAFVFGLRQYIENHDAAIKLDRMRETAQILIEETIDGKHTQQELENRSYDLQAQIYDNRRRNPLIFEWLYSRQKHKDEETMNNSDEYWVEQLTKTP
jgi:membrane protease YdiL (CAAX protease family)